MVRSDAEAKPLLELVLDEPLLLEELFDDPERPPPFELPPRLCELLFEEPLREDELLFELPPRDEVPLEEPPLDEELPRFDEAFDEPLLLVEDLEEPLRLDVLVPPLDDPPRPVLFDAPPRDAVLLALLEEELFEPPLRPPEDLVAPLLLDLEAPRLEDLEAPEDLLPPLEDPARLDEVLEPPLRDVLLDALLEEDLEPPLLAPFEPPLEEEPALLLLPFLAAAFFAAFAMLIEFNVVNKISVLKLQQL